MAAAVTDRPLPPESIPTVDLHLLSQSELYTLSLCSSSAFNPHHQNDVVIPKIDRTVFNESAGSRKQTYSRLRLAPASSSYASICRRTPHLRIPKPTSIETDPERAENSKIVTMLKALFSKQSNRNGVTLASIEHTPYIPSLPSLPNLPSLPSLPSLPNQVIPVANSSGLMNVDAVNSSNSMSVGVGGVDMSNSMSLGVGKVVTSSTMSMSNLMSEGLKRKRGRPRKDKGVVPVIRDIFKYEKREDNLGNYMVDNMNGIKRKRGRGRPRKDGSMPMSMVMSTSTDTAMVVVPEDKNEEKENDKEVVVFENSVESDKENLNSKGVVVDLVALAELEDPFGPEIRRRTEGMSTDAELLGFLEGLGGRWGSRRRKRKVVDASLFGDYLPKGWSLSISLKRKEKQVWLFCRRYISPSGRQFISCKEISSYLLSISGLQGNEQLDSSHGACKMDSQNPEGVAVQENNTKDDSQLENRMISEVAGAKESTLEHMQDKVFSSSVGEIPHKDPFAEASIMADKDTIPETFDPNGNDKLDSGIDNSTPEASLRVEISSDKLSYDQQHEDYGKSDMIASKIVLDRVETSDKQSKDSPSSSYEVDDVADLADKHSFDSNSCLGPEATLTRNGIDGIPATSDKRNVVQCVSDALNTCSVEQGGFQICAPSMIDDQTSVPLASDVIGDSAVVKESIREVVGNLFYTGNMSSTSTANDLKLDSRKFATVESISGSNTNHDATNKLCLTAVGQDFTVEGTASFPSRNTHYSSIDNVRHGSLNSDLANSEQKLCSDISAVAPSGDEEIPFDNSVKSVSTFSATPHRNMVLNCGSNEHSSYAETRRDVVDALEDEREYGNFSISSLSQRNQATMEVEPRQRVSLSSLLSLSGNEKACSAENLVDLLPARHVDTSEFNEVGTSRNDEVIFSSGRTYNDVGARMTSNKERSLELSSLLSSGKGSLFGAEDNVTGVDSRSVEECRQQFSGSGLLTGSCFAEHPSNLYTVDQIYNRPVNELKFNNGQNLGNQDLALAFGDPHAGLFADTTDLEHVKYPTNCSAIPTRIEQNIDAQINVNRVNDNFVEEQGISSFSDLFSLSCNGKLWGSEPNFNHAYNRRWEVPEVNEVGTSKNKKYMVDFGGNNEQPGENVMPSGGMWRAGGNAFQSSMAGLSNPPAQSPTPFCTFDILSDKAEDGLYRLGDKYDRESCFAELGSGRTEPVEFSFLTAPNSTSFQGVPDKNSYGAGMEQPFGSSYWINKHDLVQNISSRSQVTSVCVWCRNEFLHEPVHPGNQAAIGSMLTLSAVRKLTEIRISYRRQ
ncbi:MBD domain-containing protein [Heracleum sosnowskyi]|uniref:MBD domain-containing protein n=1 Tax=Heracleum sosnowskyi TaxID=360622 RepID=A0AAD8IUU8_9APIA|nr:MBD domain-containing protein [Heracleum sosnowskyi]